MQFCNLDGFSSGLVIKRLIGFAVQELPETAEEAKEFEFTAEDIGDVINYVLLRVNKGFENLEFISGDNTSESQTCKSSHKIFGI